MLQLNKNISTKIGAALLLFLVFLLLFLLAGGYLGSRINLQPDQGLVQRFDSLCKRYERYIDNQGYAVLIDYDLPVFLKRLWVIDLKTGEPALTAHVSHAWRSGVLYPRVFSMFFSSVPSLRSKAPALERRLLRLQPPSLILRVCEQLFFSSF